MCPQKRGKQNKPNKPGEYENMIFHSAPAVSVCFRECHGPETKYKLGWDPGLGNYGLGWGLKVTKLGTLEAAFLFNLAAESVGQYFGAKVFYIPSRFRSERSW